MDPLEALAENEIVDAFGLPTVRGMINARWKNISKFFYLQGFLYLLFLGSFTAFTLSMASDDTTQTLATFYSTPERRGYAAFGIIAVISNMWFLFGEIVELRASGLTKYLSDVWNYFDISAHSLVILLLVLHCCRSAAEFEIAAITVMLIWFKLLSLLRGFRGAGVFTRLVLAIIFEIRYFLLVWSVVLLGFANAYVLLFQGKYGNDFSSNGDLHFINLGAAFVSVFRGSTGGGVDLLVIQFLVIKFSSS